MMKTFLLALLAVGYIVPAPSPTRACFCILPELSDSFKTARAVFVGEAIQITEPKTLDEKATFIERAYTIKFKISQSWKGVPFAASEFSILWLPHCYECIELPRLNETYLVFANPVPDNEHYAIVSSCNRTVGVSPGSNLTNQDINPYRDMKQLDGFTGRAFSMKPRRRL
jgi:hypothetical protein